jgi:glycosyltransferase involved in cell wall biosynthesis
VFSSSIIPTINRPTLARSVSSVLEQTLAGDDFEIIVVNDSGRPLPPGDWQASPKVRVVDTNGRERCVARNTGAAVARGRYLHFLDDDDWLAPEALQSLRQLALRAPQAAWLYGSSQLVDRGTNQLIRLEHGMNGNCFVQVMAGEWIPLQASLIDSQAFFATGGFDPRIPGIEDVDLLRRVALSWDIAGTSTVVATISMGVGNSSTNYSRALAVGRDAREPTLGSPGAFTRMRLSATSAYWRGRVVRAYLTSVVWNLAHNRLFTAASRIGYALAAVVLAGSGLLTQDFWQAVTQPYESETFIRGFRQANRPVERRETKPSKESRLGAHQPGRKEPSECARK